MKKIFGYSVILCSILFSNLNNCCALERMGEYRKIETLVSGSIGNKIKPLGINEYDNASFDRVLPETFQINDYYPQEYKEKVKVINNNWESFFNSLQVLFGDKAKGLPHAALARVIIVSTKDKGYAYPIPYVFLSGSLKSAKERFVSKKISPEVLLVVSKTLNMYNIKTTSAQFFAHSETVVAVTLMYDTFFNLDNIVKWHNSIHSDDKGLRAIIQIKNARPPCRCCQSIWSYGFGVVLRNIPNDFDSENDGLDDIDSASHKKMLLRNATIGSTKRKDVMVFNFEKQFPITFSFRVSVSNSTHPNVYGFATPQILKRGMPEFFTPAKQLMATTPIQDRVGRSQATLTPSFTPSRSIFSTPSRPYNLPYRSALETPLQTMSNASSLDSFSGNSQQKPEMPSHCDAPSWENLSIQSPVGVKFSFVGSTPTIQTPTMTRTALATPSSTRFATPFSSSPTANDDSFDDNDANTSPSSESMSSDSDEEFASFSSSSLPSTSSSAFSPVPASSSSTMNSPIHYSDYDISPNDCQSENDEYPDSTSSSSYSSYSSLPSSFSPSSSLSSTSSSTDVEDVKDDSTSYEQKDIVYYNYGGNVAAPFRE